MDDLDVEIWQSRGCPGFLEMASLHSSLQLTQYTSSASRTPNAIR
jgi:hypothetical protein